MLLKPWGQGIKETEGLMEGRKDKTDGGVGWSIGIKAGNPNRFLAPLCCLLWGSQGNGLVVCDGSSNLYSLPEH